MSVQFDLSKLNALINDAQNKLLEAKSYIESVKTPPPHHTTNELDQTTQDFDKLPWRSYQTKQVAKLDEAAWCFGNSLGAETLLEKLKANNSKVKLGAFEYILSGPEKQFISRRPIKQETT
jgi:hypothetical protein